MLTKQTVKEAVADLQERYVAFMLENLADWRRWARASDRMEAGERVEKSDIPAFFHSEYEWARIVIEMDSQGQFNWNDPRIAKLFAQAAQTPFYRLWGETITEISLRLADIAGVRSLLEAGAGRANLTSAMLHKMSERNSSLPLITTDAHEAVLQNIEKLRNDHPSIRQETLVWDVNTPPPEALLEKIEKPALLYERASLTYANYTCIRNCAAVAEVLVLGDYFNYTGELFAYDRIFDKIGVKPLMYRDAKTVLDECFPNRHIVDQEVTDTLGLPNVSLIIAWK